LKIVKRQEVTITIASGESSGTATLTGFSNLVKMVPKFGSYRYVTGGTPDAEEIFVNFKIDSTSQITAERNAASGNAITARVYVLEFGADTTVQKGTWSMADGVATDDVSISALTLAESYCFYYQKGTDADVTYHPDDVCVSLKFNSTTELGFERTGTTGSNSGNWYVVSSNTLTVEHGSHSEVGGTGTTMTDTITSVTMAETFIISSYRTSEVDFVDEAMCTVDLQNATTIRWRRGFDDAEDFDFEYQIISDSNINVQRGEFTANATTDNDTISPVVVAQTIVKTGCGRSGFDSNADFAQADKVNRFWEIFLNSATQINGEVGLASSTMIQTWEVIDFEFGINRLDAAASGTGTTLVYTVSSGTNRVLLAFFGWENSTAMTLDSVDYGGQAMTPAFNIVTADAGVVAGSACFYLTDVGIDAASTNVITPTYSETPNSNQLHAASYENLNQSSPLVQTKTDETNASTPNPFTTLDLTEAIDNLVVAIVAGGNNTTHSWQSDMTEQTDIGSGTSSSSMGDRLSRTNANVTIEVTVLSQNRAAAGSAEFLFKAPAVGLLERSYPRGGNRGITRGVI